MGEPALVGVALLVLHLYQLLQRRQRVLDVRVQLAAERGVVGHGLLEELAGKDGVRGHGRVALERLVDVVVGLHVVVVRRARVRHARRRVVLGRRAPHGRESGRPVPTMERRGEVAEHVFDAGQPGLEVVDLSLTTWPISTRRGPRPAGRVPTGEERGRVQQVGAKVGTRA